MRERFRILYSSQAYEYLNLPPPCFEILLVQFQHFIKRLSYSSHALEYQPSPNPRAQDSIQLTHQQPQNDLTRPKNHQSRSNSRRKYQSHLSIAPKSSSPPQSSSQNVTILLHQTSHCLQSQALHSPALPTNTPIPSQHPCTQTRLSPLGRIKIFLYKTAIQSHIQPCYSPSTSSIPQAIENPPTSLAPNTSTSRNPPSPRTPLHTLSPASRTIIIFLLQNISYHHTDQPFLLK